MDAMGCCFACRESVASGSGAAASRRRPPVASPSTRAPASRRRIDRPRRAGDRLGMRAVGEAARVLPRRRAGNNSIQFNSTKRPRRDGHTADPFRNPTETHGRDTSKTRTGPRRTTSPDAHANLLSHHSDGRRPTSPKTPPRHQRPASVPQRTSQPSVIISPCVRLPLTPAYRLIARPGVAPPLEPLLHLRSMLQWRWQRRGHRRPAGGRGAAAPAHAATRRHMSVACGWSTDRSAPFLGSARPGKQRACCRGDALAAPRPPATGWRARCGGGRRTAATRRHMGRGCGQRKLRATLHASRRPLFGWLNSYLSGRCVAVVRHRRVDGPPLNARRRDGWRAKRRVLRASRVGTTL